MTFAQNDTTSDANAPGFWDGIEDDIATAELEANGVPSNPRQVWKERCSKCNGTGTFGYYRVGQCYACKGKGMIERFTAPEVRAKATARKAANKTAAADAWIAANPVEHAWIMKAGKRSEFAAKMGVAVIQYGHLTERQMETVQRLAKADAERDAQWAKDRAERDANAPAITVAKIEAAISAAIEHGIKRPVLRLASFKFSPAPVTGKNAGAIYVKSTDGEYLGKVQEGTFKRAFGTCTEELAAEVVAVAADPEAAAVAYGKRFGQCACCGRELSNAESIERGIGPICATKFGW
jgi:hypothetical protein